MAEQSPWAVLGLIGVGVAAWWFLKADGGESTGSDDGATYTDKGPGWYVLKYDQMGEHGKGKGRLKEWEGPFDDQEDAEDEARKARAGGWRGKTARAVVKHKKKSPW